MTSFLPWLRPAFLLFVGIPRTKKGGKRGVELPDSGGERCRGKRRANAGPIAASNYANLVFATFAPALNGAIGSNILDYGSGVPGPLALTAEPHSG